MPQGPTGRRSREIQISPDVRKVGNVSGFATLGSGQASVVASTPLVTSGSLVMFSVQAASFGAIASNQGAIVIRSIHNNVGIVFGTISAVAFPWPTVIHWTISDTTA